MRRSRIWSLVLVALVLAAAAAAKLPVDRPALAPRQGPPLKAAQSWGYQLQHLNAALIPADVDLVVVDPTEGRIGESADEGALHALRTRPGRTDRIVLAYLSIGEAERYRDYWRPSFDRTPPSWLGPENAAWRGNYAVRYWDAGWQANLFVARPTIEALAAEIVMPDRRPLLDRLLEAGYDGVYLDRVDAFATWESDKPEARKLMIDLVRRISAYAKARRPGFLIVAQNGEELLKDENYRRALDGVAKEDLLFGLKGDGSANEPEDFRESVADLNLARDAGLPVFVVEYLVDAAAQAVVLEQLSPLGYRVAFTRRALDAPPMALGKAP